MVGWVILPNSTSSKNWWRALIEELKKKWSGAIFGGVEHLGMFEQFFHKVELFFDGVECSKQAFSMHSTKINYL